MPDDLIFWADIEGQKKVVAQRYRTLEGHLTVDWFVPQRLRQNLLDLCLQEAFPPT